MKSEELGELFKKIKTEIFHYILVVDDSTFNNKYLVLLITILELTVLQYFYINPHYTHLNNFAVFQQYFRFVDSYLFHIQPFANPTLSINILAFYPFAMVLVYLIRKLNKNKLLEFILHVAIFIFPLISVKVLIECIRCWSNNQYLYITIPLGTISLVFGGLISILTKRLYRYIQIPIVIGIQLNLNQYAVMVILLIRLVILGHLFCQKHQYMVSYMFELGCFISMLSFLYCNDEFLNYLGFAVIVIFFTLYGLFLVLSQFSKDNSLYQKAQNMQQQEEDNIFDVIQAIQRHQTECKITNCRCHQYWEIQPKKMKQFVYEFQQERLRRKSSFNQIVEYARQCCERYQFRLSGLIKIYSHTPNTIYQEYNIFKICNVYEENLRKQDKDYNAGQSYFNINQEEHDFSNKVQDILEKIKVFWNLVLNFDGSHKFLTSITSISQSIVQLRETYLAKRYKYDDKAATFVHIMQLFNSIILNQKISEEDRVSVPESVIFMVTNQDTIIKANNNFAILANASLQHLLNKKYNQFIPEIYREVHSVRVDDYIQNIEGYQGKSLWKCFSNGQIEIKMVQMTHKILPRFMNGLQIFTRIQYPVKHRKNINNSFMFIVEKDSFIIKNVEPTFFDIIHFKINQRNIKILQEMALNSIFDSFSITAHSHGPAETKINSQFLEQFTYMKKPEQKDKRISNLYERAILKINKAEEFHQIYQYEVINNQHNQDPYLKVLFNLKSAKNQIQQKNSDSSLYQYDSTPTQEQDSLQDTKAKQVQFITPYYMALFLLILHLIYINIQDISQNTIQDLQKRYQFYQAFDSTILSSLNIVVGSHEVSKLQSLWIQGYGNFSESFNAFLNIKQSIFNAYFAESISTKFHNDLYFYIKIWINDKTARVNLYKIVLLVIVLCGVIHFLIDFFLSLKYIFKIESKVAELLLQFVIISENDVQKFIAIIDHFIENILNSKGIQIKDFNIPIQTIQESALQLIRGGSISIYLQEEQESNFKGRRKLNHTRRKLSVNQQLKRIQSSLMILDLKDKQEKSKPIDKKQFCQEGQNERIRNIAQFKQGYESSSFIIKKNKKLFIIVLLNLIISCTTILGLLYVIYLPTTYFTTQLNIASKLHQSKIILMKSLEQIAINNYTLMPNSTVSNNLITIQLQLGKINNTAEFAHYYKTFHLYLQQNACQYSNITQCSFLNNQIISFGLGVVTGYVEQYFRLKNRSALFKDSTSNYLVSYQIAVFEILIQKFLSASIQYRNGVHILQLNYIFFGSIVLFFGLLASHLSLKEFKNRIEDSEQLLKIIPKEIKGKKEQMQSCFQKELQ